MGRPEVIVRELAASAERRQVSNGGGEEPMWSAGGRTLFYSLEGRLMRSAVDTAGTFAASRPELMFDGVHNLRPDAMLTSRPRFQYR